MGLRENAKGTVIAQIMDSPAQLFAKSMQQVASTIRTITDMPHAQDGDMKEKDLD